MDDVGAGLQNLKGKRLYRYDDIQFLSTYIFIVINFKTRKGDFAGLYHQPLANYIANARAVLQQVHG